MVATQGIPCPPCSDAGHASSSLLHRVPLTTRGPGSPLTRPGRMTQLRNALPSAGGGKTRLREPRAAAQAPSPAGTGPGAGPAASPEFTSPPGSPDPPPPPPPPAPPPSRPHRPLLARPRPAPLHQSRPPLRTCGAACGPSCAAPACPPGMPASARSRGAGVPPPVPAHPARPPGARAPSPAGAPNASALSIAARRPATPLHPHRHGSPGAARRPGRSRRPPSWSRPRARHSPDDQVPGRGRPAARAVAAARLRAPPPPLPQQALAAATPAPAAAAAGATGLPEAARGARGRRRAAQRAQEERQARAHGAGGRAARREAAGGGSRGRQVLPPLGDAAAEQGGVAASSSLGRAHPGGRRPPGAGRGPLPSSPRAPGPLGGTAPPGCHVRWGGRAPGCGMEAPGCRGLGFWHSHSCSQFGWRRPGRGPPAWGGGRMGGCMAMPPAAVLLGSGWDTRTWIRPEAP